MRTQFRFLAGAIAISLACLSSAYARGEDSSAAVRASLASVESWLGSGPNAEAWAKYLDLAALAAQLQKGDKADRAAVAAVQEKLASGAAGLELPPFAKLREAVAQWGDELEILQAPNLSAAALGAEKDFRPISDADVSTSKAALQAAAAKLDRYLTGDNGAAWKKYLQWDALQAQLKAETPDVEVLADVYQKFTADQVGLEMPVFANVGDALARWTNDVAGHTDQLQKQFAEQLKGLADGLEKYVQDPSSEGAIDVGSKLGWLEDMRQAAALVRAVRSRYSQANLHVAASARLVGAGIQQKLDETTPVRDYILGTDIYGNGHTLGDVTAELVPSTDRAMFDTMLAGTVRTRSTGYNGPATIYTNGATAIAGRKRIVLADTGFASYPATAAANTSTLVTGIGGGGLVQRVAWRRVGQQKSEAERIAADHAADRVRDRMDKQVGEQLSKAHADYLRKIRNPLVRRREFPSLHFSTTKELLLVTALAANRSQIAAPAPPPDVSVENDLGVQIHESMINNLAAALLGGRKMTEEELQEFVIDLRGELPEALKSDPDRDPWSITFARSQPVTVKFGEEMIEITIRGQRYTSGDRDFRAMNVTAKYKYAIDGPGVKLTRQGDLHIVPPGEPRALSGREITLRTLLEKRFGKMFEPEVKYEGLILPGKWRAAGILDLKELKAAGGWMVLAWIESGVAAPPEEEKPKPGQADRVTQSAR
jgi:hypothetical protein